MTNGTQTIIITLDVDIEQNRTNLTVDAPASLNVFEQLGMLTKALLDRYNFIIAFEGENGNTSTSTEIDNGPNNNT